MKAGHGPTKSLSDIDCGAFNHAFHASRPLTDIYMYMYTVHTHSTAQ